MNLLIVESLKLNETKRRQYERPESDERGGILSVDKIFKIEIGTFWSSPILSAVHGEIHLLQSAGQYLANLALTLSLAIYNPIYWEGCRNPVNEVTNIRTIQISIAIIKSNPFWCSSLLRLYVRVGHSDFFVFDPNKLNPNGQLYSTNCFCFATSQAELHPNLSKLCKATNSFTPLFVSSLFKAKHPLSLGISMVSHCWQRNYCIIALWAIVREILKKSMEIFNDFCH